MELDEVVKLISLYSLVNPALKQFHRIREDTDNDAITYQKKLYTIGLRNFNIVYALIRIKFDLLSTKKEIVMRIALPSLPQETCAFTIECMCDNFNTCTGCIKGLKGKHIIMKDAKRMGRGYLLIKYTLCVYVTTYEGKVTKFRPVERNSYVLEIKCPEASNQQEACYLDAKNSKSLGRFANHSFINNEVLCKMSISNREIPKLWIKAITSISKNVNYNEKQSIPNEFAIYHRFYGKKTIDIWKRYISNANFYTGIAQKVCCKRTFAADLHNYLQITYKWSF